MTEAQCPLWMSQADFMHCRADPYRAFDTAQRYIATLRRNICFLQSSRVAAQAHPLLALGRAAGNFDRLRAELLSLQEAHTNVLQERDALLHVATSLRASKHERLVAICTARREAHAHRIEFDALAAKLRRLQSAQSSREANTAAQERQLAALDEQMHEAHEGLSLEKRETESLRAEAEALSQQTQSLVELRSHLDATRVTQETAIGQLRKELTQSIAARDAIRAELWSVREDYTTRLTALRRSVEERQDALDTARRLSEHEMESLAAQNIALTTELRKTAEALRIAQSENISLSDAERRELSTCAADAQRCEGVVLLVDEQNKALRGAIERAERQLQQTAAQIAEKDAINSKGLDEQANAVSIVHMELQTTLEDIEIARAQLCGSCYDEIVGICKAEEPVHVTASLGDRKTHDRYYDKHSHQPTEPQRRSLHKIQSNEDTHICPNKREEKEKEEEEEEEEEGRRAEVTQLREALDALHTQLLEERAAREEQQQQQQQQQQRREESSNALLRRADAEANAVFTAARHCIDKEDNAKRTAGEEVMTYTVRLADFTLRRVDAFPSDTVSLFASRMALRLGTAMHPLPLRLAEAMYETDSTSSSAQQQQQQQQRQSYPVLRFLDETKSLAAEGITPVSSLVFVYKHYKRPVRWPDPVAQEWFFRQLQQRIVREVYPVLESTAVRLASFQLQAIFGDHSVKKECLYFDQVGLDAYLPVSVSAHAYEYWQQRLANSHRQRKGLSAAKARDGFIDIMRTTPFWGMTFFDVRDRDHRPFVVGVAEDGLFVFSVDRHERLDALPFPSLSGWELDTNGVAVRRRDSGRKTLLATSPLQAKEMVDLLDEYYLLLPRVVRDELCIELARDADALRAGLPNPTLFDFPVVDRPMPVLYASRVEYLKAAYMSFCAEPDAYGRQREPVMALVQSMDAAVDTHSVMHSMDFTDCDPPIDDHHLAVLVDIVQYALREYRPRGCGTSRSLTDTQDNNNITSGKEGTGNEWEENIDITSLRLGQPSAVRQLLTAAAVPKIAQFINLFPSLAVLDLSYIPIDAPAEIIGAALASCARLERLLLRGCLIGARALQSVLLIFSAAQPSSLRELNLSENFLTHAAMHPLCEAIRTGRTSIADLSVASNRIESIGIDALLAAARAAPQFIALDLSRNPGLTPPSTRAALAAAKGTGLTRIALRACDAHFAQFLTIDAELSANGDLLAVDLSGNPIGDDPEAQQKEINQTQKAFRFLRAAPESVGAVVELRLDDCALQEGIIADALGNALAVNESLNIISLRGNALARRSGFISPHLANALGTHRALRCVDVSGNGLSYAGAMRIFAAIIRSATLEELRMDENNIGDSPTDEADAFVELSALLEHCAALRLLSVCGAGLRDNALIRMGEGLARRRTLLTLKASGNGFTPQGIAAFARHIQHNDTLKTLDLSTDAIRENETVYADTFRLLAGAGNMDSVNL